MRKCNLQNSIIDHADLWRANLTNATMRRVDLSYSDLKNAQLNHADLSNAILVGSCLESVDFENTKLDNVNLENSDLTQAINITPRQLARAKSLKGATINPVLLTKIKEINPEIC